MANVTTALVAMQNSLRN